MKFEYPFLIKEEKIDGISKFKFTYNLLVTNDLRMKF
jgi:hypothetical protein